jgi:hypothetical protein
MIGNDDTCYWSPEARAYVTTADPKRTTNVPDETQLNAILARLMQTENVSAWNSIPPYSPGKLKTFNEMTLAPV